MRRLRGYSQKYFDALMECNDGNDEIRTSIGKVVKRVVLKSDGSKRR